MSIAEAMADEFQAEWEKDGALFGVTIYRSQISNKIVVGLTDRDGSWNALALNDGDAREVRNTLQEIL